MVTASSNTNSTKPSAADTAKQLKVLLKPVKDERADAARLDELRRIFSTQDLSPNKSSNSEAVQKWKAHLTKQLNVFVSQLTDRMHRKTTVRTFWGVLAAMPAYSPTHQHAYCSEQLLKKFLGSIPTTSITDDKVFRTMVESEFLHQYVDVQYYAYVALAQLAEEQYSRRNKNDDDDKNENTLDEEEAGDLLFQLLTLLPRIKSQDELDEGTYLFPPPASGEAEEEDSDDDEEDEEEDDGSDSEEDEESESDEEEAQQPAKKRKMAIRKEAPKIFRYQQLKAHRKVMARAWLGIMKLKLPTSALKLALQLLPTQVLPYVPNPLRFADFFVQAYGNHSSGGTSVVPILALDGLFLLLMEHNLEYPLFYRNLYRLISPTLFHVKYRIRFFQLLIKCLTRNEMLPAHIVAAFLKRLLRSSLQAPPSGCLFALALSSNLLRKHEECASLIHKSGGSSIEDHFDADTDDPTKARALESSLWELTVLEKHYYPAVSTMASSLGRMETKQAPMHDMEDFLVHTYKSLFDQERKRLEKKRKKVPLAFVKPTSLFVETDVFAGMLQLGGSETN